MLAHSHISAVPHKIHEPKYLHQCTKTPHILILFTFKEWKVILIIIKPPLTHWFTNANQVQFATLRYFEYRSFPLKYKWL